MTTTKDKYVKALNQIRELEAEYGSIAVVPEYEPRLEKIHALMNPEFASKPININLSQEKIKSIEYLIKYGYSSAQIASQSLVSKDNVLKVMRVSHIRSRKVFTHLAVKNNVPNIYFANFLAVGAGLGIGSSGKDKVVKALITQGYSLETSKYYWGDIPDGSLYSIGGRTLYEKEGIDSYGEKSTSFNLKK